MPPETDIIPESRCQSRMVLIGQERLSFTPVLVRVAPAAAQPMALAREAESVSVSVCRRQAPCVYTDVQCFCVAASRLTRL